MDRFGEFVVRYRGQPQRLSGDDQPSKITAVALCRDAASAPRLMLLLEKQVGPKANKVERSTRIYPLAQWGSSRPGVDMEQLKSGSYGLQSDDHDFQLHLQLHPHHVDPREGGEKVLKEFHNALIKAGTSQRAPDRAPTVEELTKLQSGIGAAPLAKKPRLGGGPKPVSNLGGGSGRATTPGGPAVGFGGVPVNMWNAKKGSTRPSRQLMAAQGVAPRKTQPHQLPPPYSTYSKDDYEAPDQNRPPPQSSTSGSSQIQPRPPSTVASASTSRGGALAFTATASSGTLAPMASGSGGGFRNLGNTCYINATLAALLGLRPFVRDLLRPSLADRLMPHVPPVSVYRALAALARDHANGDTATPRPLKQAIEQRCSQFVGHEQQDAHEFLADCLDLLHDEMLDAAKTDAKDEVTPPLAAAGGASVGSGDASAGASGEGGGGAVVGKAAALATKAAPIPERALPSALNFACEVEHTLTCLRCKHAWSRTEMTRDFCLEVPPGTTGGAKPTIQSLLQAFFASDELEVGCEKCGHPRARVEHHVSRLPRVLVLQLKRFEVTAAGAVRKRLDAVTPLPSLSIDFACTPRTQPPPVLAPPEADEAASRPSHTLAPAPAAAAAGAAGKAGAAEPSTALPALGSAAATWQPTTPSSPALPSPSGGGVRKKIDFAGVENAHPTTPLAAPLSERSLAAVRSEHQQQVLKHKQQLQRESHASPGVSASLDAGSGGAAALTPNREQSVLAKLMNVRSVLEVRGGTPTGSGGASRKSLHQTHLKHGPYAGGNHAAASRQPQRPGPPTAPEHRVPRPNSKEEWHARRKHEDDELARAIAASLGDAGGGDADSAAAGAGAAAGAAGGGNVGSDVIELDGVEDGDDEDAQLRRAIEASLVESERAAAPAGAPTEAAAPAEAAAVSTAAAEPSPAKAADSTAQKGPTGTPVYRLDGQPAAATATAPAPELIDLDADSGAASGADLAAAADVGGTAAGRYELSGVVWHTGTAAGAGHYVADVKQGAAWKRFNDAHVSSVARDAVLQRDALTKGYIFFYEHASTMAVQ